MVCYYSGTSGVLLLSELKPVPDDCPTLSLGDGQDDDDDERSDDDSTRSDSVESESDSVLEDHLDMYGWEDAAENDYGYEF